MSRDYGLEAHAAAEARLIELDELMLDDEMYGDDDEAELRADLVGAFCGCHTCVVREVLEIAWPILLQAAEAEISQGKKD